MKNRLKVLRAENDWTQADLADRAGVVRQTIVAWENGKYSPQPRPRVQVQPDLRKDG